MTMKKPINKPLNEHEKQNNPLPGETSPEEALIKALQFAELEKSQLKTKKGNKTIGST